VKNSRVSNRLIKFRLRDTRRFVESRLKNLQSMFSGEPRLARAAIAQHVQKITLKPEGRSYIASGVWDWLGGVAVTMVPGARFAPRVPQSLASHWPHDCVAQGCEGLQLSKFVGPSISA
jgi:hypothetical protein